MQASYAPVHRRFLAELAQQHQAPDVTINTIRGMSLLRVKMFPVEEVEDWFLFLQKCAEFLIEVRDPRIKNSMAYTLVEILIPVSNVIRLEVVECCVVVVVVVVTSFLTGVAAPREEVRGPAVQLQPGAAVAEEGALHHDDVPPHHHAPLRVPGAVLPAALGAIPLPLP